MTLWQRIRAWRIKHAVSRLWRYVSKHGVGRVQW